MLGENLMEGAWFWKASIPMHYHLCVMMSQVQQAKNRKHVSPWLDYVLVAHYIS